MLFLPTALCSSPLLVAICLATLGRNGMMLAVTHHDSPEFAPNLAALSSRGDSDLSKVEPVVRGIFDAVRAEGDAAVLRYVSELEHRTPAPLYKESYGGEAALASLPKEARDALELAAARIRAFADAERDAMFGQMGFSTEKAGMKLGLRVRPLSRVGVYAPGGKARYPSSVLMSAIFARAAGVKDVVLATPLAGDASDASVLAAAHLAGVTAVLDAGGAQAIAALAMGTASVKRVDKIVGPGNIYVACAKRLAFGLVAIDSIAGPSEILVVADSSADPKVVAADLLSQAEHDEDAYPLLVTDSRALAAAVSAALETQLSSLPRARIAGASVSKNGHCFVVAEGDRAALAATADAIAAEHLSLQVRDPEGLLAQIPNAGAAFVGALTPEAAGDYVAGPSHVLPTGGAVRFGSPLGVHDFVARTSIIRYSADALERDAGVICALARLEGLEAHAQAVLMRTRSRAGSDDQGVGHPTRA